jgi:hypothetical protein
MKAGKLGSYEAGKLLKDVILFLASKPPYPIAFQPTGRG